jgi:hypothetical protein
MENNDKLLAHSIMTLLTSIVLRKTSLTSFYETVKTVNSIDPTFCLCVNFAHPLVIVVWKI